MDISEEINKFLWNYFPVPVEKASTKFEWLQNKSLSKINNTKIVYKDAIDLFERTISLLSFEILHEEIAKNTPLFGSNRLNDDRYDSREDSTQKLTEFLQFQLEEQYDEFIDFFKAWISKKSGKFNCLNIIGPPSCGKTWFARLVKEACITAGQITNMNRNSSFPFNNCINKRILHWDEPSFDPTALDDLKMLFSGDEISVNVKYSPHTIIPRTPVIVTANHYCFPRDEAFNVRIKTYRFRTFPILKNWIYLNPLCIYDLIL